jgi:hypothetical protein
MKEHNIPKEEEEDGGSSVISDISELAKSAEYGLVEDVNESQFELMSSSNSSSSSSSRSMEETFGLSFDTSKTNVGSLSSDFSSPTERSVRNLRRRNNDNK